MMLKLSPALLALCLGAAIPASAQVAIQAQQSPPFSRFDMLRQRIGQRSLALQQAWLAKTGHLPDAASAPKILSGTIDTPMVDLSKAPGAPKVTVRYAAGASGLSAIFAAFQAGNSTQFIGLQYFNGALPYPAANPISLQAPNGNPDPLSSYSTSFGPYAANGTWNVSYVEIDNGAGQSKVYQGAAAQALFTPSSLTVTNSPAPDITPPALSSGTIITKTVSESSNSPIALFNFKASDALSGVASGSISAVGPGNSENYGNLNLSAPITSGTVPFYLFFGPDSGAYPIGAYTINYVQICDVAGNCITYNTPDQITQLFGAGPTFQVIN